MIYIAVSLELALQRLQESNQLQFQSEIYTWPGIQIWCVLAIPELPIQMKRQSTDRKRH